jgi:hypothetical protein
MQLQIDELEEKTVKNEQYSRRANVRIYGLAEA